MLYEGPGGAGGYAAQLKSQKFSEEKIANVNTNGLKRTKMFIFIQSELLVFNRIYIEWGIFTLLLLIFLNKELQTFFVFDSSNIFLEYS